MRKIFFTYNTGFCGSDGYEVIEFDDNVTDALLDEYAHQGALENAEMYGYYPTQCIPEGYDDDQDYDGGDEYTDGIEGTWCDYVEEKHRGYVN